MLLIGIGVAWTYENKTPSKQRYWVIYIGVLVLGEGEYWGIEVLGSTIMIRVSSNYCLHSAY